MRRLSKNKRGQWVFAGIMIIIMVIIVLTQFISPLKSVIGTARGPSGLDCANESISTGTTMACIVVDTYLFYFLGMAFAFGVGYIFNKQRKSTNDIR